MAFRETRGLPKQSTIWAMPDIVSSNRRRACVSNFARRCVRVCGATILQGRLLGAGVGERGAADACTCCLRWCTAPVAMLASRLVRVLTVVAVCVALFVAAEGAGGVITAAVTRDMEKVRLPCVV